MSRQGHLPPRCPFQKKPISHSIHETIYPSHIKSYPGHYKSPSQSSILEEQPAWLDDLLSDPDMTSHGILHRRSTSDSVALMDGIVDSFSSLTTVNDEANSVADETCSGLGTACIYGPSSPRGRSNLTSSENALASAFSECVPQNLLQYVDDSLCVAGITDSYPKDDACGSVGMPNSETKTAKRYSGQRSRVRKLQYIAELERTVEVLQTMVSELSVRVATLLQQRVALSLESSKLKQQVARLKQKKLMAEGQYQSLKREAEILKTGWVNYPGSKVGRYPASNTITEAARPDVTWQMLDMGKLNLN